MTERERFVTFDGALPENLVASLNNSYHEEELSSEYDDRTYAQTQKQAESTNLLGKNAMPHKQRPESGERKSSTTLPQTSRKMGWCSNILILIVLSSMIFGFASWATSNTQKEANSNGSVNNPPRTNLALSSEGARILMEYTTPPYEPLVKWAFWLFNDKTQFDPECVIRPRSAECWPLTAESSIGIELGKPSSVKCIKVDCEVAQKLLIEDLTIYTVSSTGEIQFLRKIAHWSVCLAEPIEASRFIIRIRLKKNPEYPENNRDPKGVWGCLRTVSISGAYL